MSVPTVFRLRPRDRIVFLGDSITEQQLYSNSVESYLASRFPGLDLIFFNAGCWGFCARFDGLRTPVATVLPVSNLLP